MLPKPACPRTCALCGLGVNPLVSRYLFLNVGWRGRGTPKPHTTTEVILCGPCGKTVLERLSPYVAPVKLPMGEA